MGFVSLDDTFTAKVGDKEYKMSYPTFAQINDLQAKLKSAADDSSGEIYASFFKELGLPGEVYEKMSVRSVMALVQYVMDFEKKS